MSSSVKITSLLGNSQRLDGGAMFGNAPKALWERWVQPDERNRIPLACRGMLVQVEDRLVLCETGIGQFFEPKLRDRFGVEGKGEVLLQSLQKSGFKEEEVTDVILSHLHFDHAGGLLSAYEAGEPYLHFSKASYFVGEEAWERAIHPHARDKASFVPVLNQLLEKSGRLKRVKGDKHPELPKNFSFRYSSGHTPGQMHTVVQGQKNRICFAGDLIPATAWVHVPITMGYDRYPEMLIEEKETLLSEWEKNQDWIFFTHDHQIAAAKIRLDREKNKFEADQAQANLQAFSI